MAAKKVSVIPATKSYERNGKSHKNGLRVAAYCRVSTLQEQQETSYEAQVTYYTQLIENNPEWKMAGIYADDGITGTNIKNRDDFNAMIEDCKKGKIDMVITKSISRFARNTVDSLQHIRMLKEKNIAVYFEKEGINTLESAGELLITILSSQAQEESRNISENVKWSLRRKYENGGVHTGRLLGYKSGLSGRLEIVPEEAETVRFIYEKYIEGQSITAIGEELKKQGKKTIRGSSEWSFESIKRILRNEKYVGDVLSQKTYTTSFLTKRREVNHGVLPQYYVENAHEAIISREVYAMAKAEMDRRDALRVSYGSKKRKVPRSKYSSKYALTSIMVCQYCGHPYRRQMWSKNGEKKAVWRCNNRLRNGPKNCSNSPTLNEEILQRAILQAINKIIENKEEYIEAFRENVMSVLTASLNRQADYEAEIERLKYMLVQMLEERSETEQYEEKYKEICQKIDWLRNEKKKNDKSSMVAERLIQIDGYLKRGPEMKEYDDVLIRKLIQRIEVINERKIRIQFKSGIVTEQVLE